MENKTVSPARAAAAEALRRCRRFDAWSQQALQSVGEKYALSGRDRALCANLCLSVLQNAALCDHYISAFSSVPAAKLQPRVLDILRLGVCQILFMDRIPDRAAVDESVQLVRSVAPKAAGLVNAVLRRVSEHKNALPAIPGEGTAEELSVRFSHPAWLCSRIAERYGFDFARDYLKENNLQPDLTVSANLCKTTPEELVRLFAQAGLQPQQNTVSEVSVSIPDAGAVTALPGFAEGLFFVQDAAAAASVCAAAPREGMRVLDLCAAPGGKSLLCASLMRDRGEILSCDLHEKKLARIEENAARLGFSSIRTAPMDASRPYEQLRCGFDLVIADVPCSGLGVIRKKPEIRYKPEAEIRALPEIQLRILRGAAKCTAHGGELLYSTCTILREENEDVVRAFLSGNDEFSVVGSRTIWPQEAHTDGFYYCLMKRK